MPVAYPHTKGLDVLPELRTPLLDRDPEPPTTRRGDYGFDPAPLIARLHLYRYQPSLRRRAGDDDVDAAASVRIEDNRLFVGIGDHARTFAIRSSDASRLQLLLRRCLAATKPLNATLVFGRVRLARGKRGISLRLHAIDGSPIFGCTFKPDQVQTLIHSLGDDA